MTSPATTQSLLQQAAELQNAGKLHEARSVYQWVLEAEPDNPVALHLTGVLAQQVGRPDIGERMIRRALAVLPEYPEAHYNLASLLQSQERLEEAEAEYRATLKALPGHPGALNNLANVLRALARDAEAVEFYRRCVEARPDFAEGWDNLGNVLTALGEFKEAQEALEKAVQLRPAFGQAWRHLSLVKRSTPEEMDIMRAQLTSAQAGNGARADLHFALAKAEDDLKNYDEAFLHYLKGNRLRRGEYTYSTDESRQEFSRLQAAFATALADADLNAGHADETPVFILGMPRSGTSLVEQMLASHAEVHGAGETLHMPHTALYGSSQHNMPFPEYISRLTADERHQLAQHYLSRLARGVPKHVSRITDKLPDNFKLIGLIALILPRARIIHCVRDPMDTCVSIFRSSFTARHAYACSLPELGQYYRLYEELMAFWNAELAGRIYEVRYETLVEEPESTARALFTYCGLAWDARALQFHETKRSVLTASSVQVRQPLYRSSVTAWKRYEKHLGPLKQALGV